MRLFYTLWTHISQGEKKATKTQNIVQFQINYIHASQFI